MSKQRSLALKGLWVLGAFSFVGAKGCVFDGDASLGSDPSDGGASAQAGTSSTGGSAASGGKRPASAGSGSGARAGVGGGGATSSAGETGSTGGSASGAGGEPTAGGSSSSACDLPIEAGPCDAAFPRYAYDVQAGKCAPFVYGGCEGNANNFATLQACEAECVQVSCPSHLQTDTVYVVQPLNRPERACLLLEAPRHVSCSMLLEPSLTVPTNWPQTRCVIRDGATFYAGTTLPKADGWTDCSAAEAKLVDQIGDCRDLDP